MANLDIDDRHALVPMRPLGGNTVAVANADRAPNTSSVAADGPPRAAPATPPAALSAWLTLCLVLQLGLARVLNFDPGASGPHSGIASQLLILATYVSGLAILASSPRTLSALRRCWPVVALPVLAILSTAWSAYPALTLRSGILYALTTLLGFAIAVALPPKMALGVVVRAMGYVCVLSAGYALFLPELGVHQANELVQFIHAGLWRGILGHKVNLGIFAGLTLPLVIFYRTLVFKSSLLWLLVTACAAACLWNASSITGMLGAALLGTLLLLFQVIARRPATVRAPMLNGVLAVLL